MVLGCWSVVAAAARYDYRRSCRVCHASLGRQSAALLGPAGRCRHHLSAVFGLGSRCIDIYIKTVLNKNENENNESDKKLLCKCIYVYIYCVCVDIHAKNFLNHHKIQINKQIIKQYVENSKKEIIKFKISIAKINQIIIKNPKSISK